MENKEWYSHQLEYMAERYGIAANPAPGQKYQARAGLFSMPELDGAVVSLMACLIDHAHEKWGFAFPGHKRIEAWTGRSRWAIDRAIAKAKKLGLIPRAIERRHGDDSELTIFVINWKPFFAAYRRQQLVSRRRGRCESAQEGTAKSRRGHRESAVQNQVTDPRIKEPCTSRSGEASDNHKEICSEPKRHQSENGIQCGRIGEGPTTGDHPESQSNGVYQDDDRLAALNRWGAAAAARRHE